ncbi:MAG: isocitrate lyase/PEP mutase family protein [Planctomycetaceae bacterium]
MLPGRDDALPSGPVQLRRLLARPGIVRSFGIHDVLSGLVFQQAGVELLFAGGFGIAASGFGYPDVGLVTLTEMATAVSHMAGRLNVPVVADGDTGHGGLHNVARSVREFEQAGAAGMLLEDQVFPKRCGHFGKKQVVSEKEMLDKLRVALDSRRSDEFVIFARTDSLATEGIDAAIRRAQACGELGADVCFVEAPTDEWQLRRIADEVPFPLLANMLVGGQTPILSAKRLEEWGYKFVVCPISSLLVSATAMHRLAKTFLEEGRLDAQSTSQLDFEELKQLLGLPSIDEYYEKST